MIRKIVVPILFLPSVSLLFDGFKIVLQHALMATSTSCAPDSKHQTQCDCITTFLLSLSRFR